jgi:acyl carrier protein
MRSIRAVVVEQLQQVAAEQDRQLAPLSDDLVLMDSGLDSLCLAIIVARLEDELGFDPFDGSDDAQVPVTLGDFIRSYEEASKSTPARSA